MSGRLLEAVGPSDFVARLGGDEFAILQRDVVSDGDVSELIAQDLSGAANAVRLPRPQPRQRRQHRHCHRAAPRYRPVRPAQERRSGDVCGEGGRPPDLSLLRTVDGSAGQHPPRTRAGSADGDADGGFEIHYQPMVDLRSNAIAGCEALLRWRHPVRGMVSPAEFIPIAEETGLIEEIGQWVLRTACAEAATWPAAHPRCRQRLADPVQVADAVAEGRRRAGRDRPRPAPAGARDHRSRADRR